MPRKNKQPPHVKFVFKSSCTEKRRFATEHQAKDTIEHQELIRPDVQLSAYRCELCGGWHLTRNKQ